MDKSIRATEQEAKTTPAAEAMPFAASWDVFYQDAQCLECHLQLKGTSLDAVLDEAKRASMSITESGGKPSRRMNSGAHSGEKPKENGNASASANAPREPAYTDERGVRRCNRKLTDGSVCGRPVTEKEGRYGAFWSCPNYKNHVPVAPR